MAPSTVGGALLPLAVYYLVRHQVGSDAAALALAGVPAAAWVLIQFARKRTIDPIGAITLFGFIAGLLASWALGGNAFVLKVRDSAFTALLGVACLASLIGARRPVMFYVGRALSAGGNTRRVHLDDELWHLPPARTVFRIITLAGGVVLLIEAAGRVVLAVVLPTGLFLAASPAWGGLVLGGAGALTIWYSRWARERVQAGHTLA